MTITSSGTLSTNHAEMFQSLGLGYRFSGSVIVVEHADHTETRLDPCDVDMWLNGYLCGKIAGLEAARANAVQYVLTAEQKSIAGSGRF